MSEIRPPFKSDLVKLTNSERDLCYVLKNITEKLMHRTPQLSKVSNNRKGEDKDEYGYWISRIEQLEYTVSLLKYYGRTNIMDLGCGACLFLKQIECLVPNIKVAGIDNEPTLLAVAHDLFHLPECKLGDLLKLTKKDVKGYDTFYIWEPFVGYSITSKSSVFAKGLAKVLKKDDMIIYNCAGSIGEYIEKTVEFHTLIPRENGITVYIKK